MTQPAIQNRPTDRMPEVIDLFRRFVRIVEFPTLLGEELRLDIEENDREYLVKADLPGVRKEDLHVTTDGHTLTIRGEAPPERHDKTAQGHRSVVSELHRGNLSRTVHLAHEIDERKVHAKLDNGVLSLTCPKRSSGKQTLVAIQ